MHRRVWHRFVLGLRAAGSFGGLAAAVLALGGLAVRLEQQPDLRLSPWPGAAAPLVVVDAGHGGHDGGAVANGLVEKQVALALAQRLRQHLEAQGLRVRMTRQKDEFISLEDRSRLANEAGAAAFVSLHLNTSAAPEVAGLETYFSRRKTLSLRPEHQDEGGRSLARSIQRHACGASGAESRGVKEKPYAVVAHTQCPAVLVECGFLTNAAEARRLNQANHQEQLAKGVAHGVAEFLKTDSGRLRGPGEIAAALAPVAAGGGGTER